MIRVGLLIALFAPAALARVTTPSPVPEPGSLIMMGMGIAGIALLARKRMKK